jgi:hypothetical protein
MRVDIYESVINPAKKLFVPAGNAVGNDFAIDTTDQDYAQIRLARKDVALRGGKKQLGIPPEQIPNIVDQIAASGYALADLPES